jgi:hypothetical protein
MSSLFMFPKFQELPTELQFSIFCYCDGPTLFQLMHVSSAIRTEAKRLFWSHPDVWYCIEGSWLMHGGYPGHTHLDFDFIARVTQVEVHFDDQGELRYDFEAKGHAGERSVRIESIEELAQVFWQTLQCRFPLATRVVVSESHPRKAVNAPPDELAAVVRACPSNIIALVSILENDEDVQFRVDRSLWHWTGREADEWTRMDRRWARHSVFPPPKSFHGPAGAFHRLNYHCERGELRCTGVNYLLLEARERHHFDGRCEPFTCPVPDCNARFTLPGEWTSHAERTNHALSKEGKIPPETFQATFALLNEELRQLDEREVKGATNEMIQAWGQEGSTERSNAENAFLDQLQHDPLHAHGKPARETITWSVYKSYMEIVL